MNPEINAHLALDPIMAPLIRQMDASRIARDNDIYLRLMRAIVGQQLSVKAAATIWSRFLSLYQDNYPAPKAVLDTPAENMRKCGLSAQKASYIINIAAFSQQYRMDLDHLDKLGNEEVIAYLGQIKGVGRWTVEMILMFALGREDVFPIDDLGVRNAMIKLYNVQSTKRQLKADLENIAAKWAPYRSYACLALWQWKDNPAL